VVATANEESCPWVVKRATNPNIGARADLAPRPTKMCRQTGQKNRGCQTEEEEEEERKENPV